MSSKNEWKRLVDAHLLKNAAPTAGAQNLAFIMMELLIHGESFSLESLHEILKGSLERAKKSENSDHYAEILLALSFFERTVFEFPSPLVGQE